MADHVIEYEFVTSMLNDPLQMHQIDIKPQMLEDQNLRMIYEIILRNQGKISPAIIYHDMNATQGGRDALLEFAGGFSLGTDTKAAVDELFNVGASSGSADVLAERIRDDALHNHIRAVIGQTKRDHFANADDWFSQLRQGMDYVASNLGGSNNSDALSVGVDEALAAYQFQLDNPGKISGIRVNLGDYDLLTGGLKPGELIMWGAHSGEGKSQCLMHQCVEAALTPIDTTGLAAKSIFFSLEMNRRQVSERMIAKIGGVDLGERVADAATRQRALDAGLKLKALNASRNLIIVESAAASSLDQICRELIRARAVDGIDIAFIDYAQLIGVKADSKYNAMATISQRLKAMALQLDIPIVVAVQLNREALRETKAARPRLYHIADGMDLVRSADMLHMLWTPAKHLQHNVGNWGGIAIALTEKRRSGPTLKNLYFHAEYKYSRLRPCAKAEVQALESEANQVVLRGTR